MRTVLAQLNFTVGDFVGNTDKIVRVIAAHKDVDMIVFSELAVSGYPPLDLVEEPDFLGLQNKQLGRIAEATEGSKTLVVVGHVRFNSDAGKKLCNSATLFRDGFSVYAFNKELLPTYNIFDEARHFQPGLGVKNIPIDICGVKTGFLICEDCWNDSVEKPLYIFNPISNLVAQGAKRIVSLNASPSNVGKHEQRLKMFDRIATTYGIEIIYVNQVGANDDIVFDGNSFVMDSSGTIVGCAASFVEDVYVHDSEKPRAFPMHGRDLSIEPITTIHNHLVTGIRDYVDKCGFKTVVVGSSGGIDSAVTLALAVEALGAENVKAITMPSVYSSMGSVVDSDILCGNLEVELFKMPIENARNAIEDGILTLIAKTDEPAKLGLEWENTQARIRGTILMAYSNRYGNLVLSTGNKSEMSVGYCTLYGDMNGGLAVLADVYKTEVFALAREINAQAGRELIPVAIIDKPPSAELAPDQKDTDSLPPYPVLDAVLKLYIEGSYLSNEERNRCLLTISDYLRPLKDQDAYDLTGKITKMVDRAEFKRRQAPPCIRVHPRAFGAGRRLPIAQRFSLKKR